jgi:DNA helicase-2/ATP-dependent DNA helicase PcrA
MDIYKELDRLNTRQREAVMHIEGPLLVLAGAGSGKTRVITMRTAYLINGGISPSSILAVTFTNKAAREMQGRVRNMVQSGSGLPVISTFHSICLRILRKEIDHLGYRKDFTIYDTSEQLSLMRNLMSDIKFYDKSFKPESILERISRTKNDFTLQDNHDSDESVEEASELIYPRYLEALKSMNVLDFDDLLLLVLKLFRKHPDVLETYRESFQYIMVDEYQDTNRVQYDFIKLLAGKKNNLCVVGDDDQSIYGWRGADISNILDFEKDFPGTLTVRLEQNYRSFDHILKAANGVIKNNISRMEKSLWTQRGDGPKVNIFKAEDTGDEAEWIADRISMITDQKNIPYEDFAVIYRANTFSRPFEEALRSKQIPYSVVGGTSYFERREIRDVVAWLKIIANPSDDLSLLRAITAPRRGLGASAIKSISDFAQSKSINILDAFGRADEIDGLSRRALSSAETFYALIHRYRDKLSKGKNTATAVKELLEEIHFREYINHLYKGPEAAFRRIENLDGLVDSIDHYESRERSPSLQGFLESMALIDMLEEKEEKQGQGVTLISFHSSKGLEFPVVFIVGAEEELIPHKKSVDTSSGVEEERRLFYVGITRAMKELFITYTEKRRKYGKEKPSVPSRFIKEIPEDVLIEIDRFVHMEPEEEKAYVKSMYENFMARFEE